MATQYCSNRRRLFIKLEELRMNKQSPVKVRPFPGADTQDMFDFIAPLLKQKPTRTHSKISDPF